MKRLMLLLLALMMLLASASADELLTLGAPLEGVICWPEGSDEASAAYVYRYSYPQIAGDSEMAGLINGVYAYEVDYAYDFRVPMDAEMLDLEPGVQSYTNITCQVTCLNERCMSVLTTTETMMGPAMSTILSSRTFALQGGASSGAETHLPYLLGLLDESNTGDEWLEVRQTNKANECVWGLVWEIIEQQMREGTVTFNDDLDYDDFVGKFLPDTDFYLDADGNPVFYIQAGSIAPLTEGVLRYPFTMEELLDEL